MYCTLDDIANILSEKELINLTNDIKTPPLDRRQRVSAELTRSAEDLSEQISNSGGDVNSTGKVGANNVFKINPDVFDAVSQSTDSLINGYLRARYKLPLKSTPGLIKTIAVDICAYRLYSRRAQKIPEHIVNNYNDSISTLKDIQKGNVLLETSGEDDAVEISNIKTGFKCSKTPRDKMFTDRIMRIYRGF